MTTGTVRRGSRGGRLRLQSTGGVVSEDGGGGSDIGWEDRLRGVYCLLYSTMHVERLRFNQQR
jgi:hypothetical protein